MTQPRPRLSVDCRMLGMSGIGVYLENILRRLPAYLPGYSLTLIGSAPRLHALSLPQPVRIVPCEVPIYTVREQIEVALAARGTDLLWVPHYNIPVMTPVPLLVTVHDVAPLILPEIRNSALRYAYARLLFGAVRSRP